MADVPKSLLEQIKELEDIFLVDQKKLKEITDHFVKELEKGMSCLFLIKVS
jgi:hexokinase